MYSRDEIACTGLGSMPINASAMQWMMDVSPGLPSPSVYSDQPIKPSSVVTFKNENFLHPASQWRSSILSIFKKFPPYRLLTRVGFGYARSACHTTAFYY